MSEIFQYSVEAGRVKAAGVPMNYFFDATNGFKDNPSVGGANEVRRFFYELRHNPPEEIRDRLLPRNRGNKDMFRNGPLVTRPTLKTDQGPGQFFPFDVGRDETPSQYVRDEEYGYVIPEIFFSQQLKKHGYPTEVMAQLETLATTFMSGETYQTQLEYENLQLLCERYGIETSNSCSVGREAVFFIHPAQAKEPIYVPQSTFLAVREIISQLGDSLPQFALEARRRFATQHGLAIKTNRYRPPLYFQADIQISTDGGPFLDQIQLPDVGLFLSILDPKNNPALKEVQDRVLHLRGNAIRCLVETLNRSGNERVSLITRPEVINNGEDTLEHLEIQTIQEGLDQYGLVSRAITLDQAAALESSDVGLLLNVNPKNSDFQTLLTQRLVDDRVPIYPDPFLLLAADQMTQYQTIRLNPTNLANLIAVVGELEPDSNPKKQFVQLIALDYLLDQLGILGDVFHIYTSSQPTPIACFRHDIRGLQIATNYIREGDEVVIRSIPVSPKNSVLFDDQGRAIYSVFRFMATLQI